VVFVSHNMTAVDGLCDRAIWLDGSIRADGPPGEVIAAYLSESSSESLARSWPDPASAPGNEQARLRSASVEIEGPPSGAISVETPIALRFEYWNLVEGADLTLSVHVRNAQDIVLFNTGPVGGRPLSRGLYRSSCVIPGGLLNDGVHRIELQVVKDEGVIIYEHADLLSFDVVDSLTGRGAWYGEWPGAVRPQLDWSTESIEDGVATSP
jgi:lipopolysaccharide transport system ATP-binding protein